MLMKRFIRTYQRLALISFLTFCVVWNFVFGAFFSFDRQEVKAVAVTWVGGTTGTWETGSNWSTAAVPTTSDDVTISSSTANIVITLSAAQVANFNSLTIGGDPTYTTELILTGSVGTGADIIVAQNGILNQQNNLEQTITNSMTIQSGGLLTHATNTIAHDYSVYFSVNTVTVQSGGSISVDEKGYGGSSGWGSPRGPGAGKWNSGGSYGRGTGAGHAGYGGKAVDTANTFMASAGGSPYCDITNPTTPGSEGYLGTNNENGGDGGGVIRIAASGTITLSGTVSANAGNGVGTTIYTSGSHGGGGSGGSINIQAGTIAGTPTRISAIGGNGGNDNNIEGAGGGGSGGCIYAQYTTANSLVGNFIQVAGGKGGQRGAGGLFYLKQVGQEGNLYSIGSGNNTYSVAETQQYVASLSLASLTIASSSVYTVTSTRSLSLSSATPVVGIGGSPTGTLKIDYGSLSIPESSTISNAVLELWRTATLVNSSSLQLTFSSNGILDLRHFTTSSALSLSSLTLQSGSLLTHGQNTTTQAHVVNISAGTITQNSGASIDVSGKGYTGYNFITNGYGPGAGVNNDGINQNASGAGHGGRGGDDVTADAGGAAYCSSTNPGTIGSSGAGGGNAADTGGNGGGFVGLTSSGSLTLAGTINANGSNAATSGGYGGGGGAGGGVRLSSGGVASINNAVISANGGNQGNHPGGGSGGGGGGCVYLIYTSAYTYTGATTSTSAGSGYTGGGTPAASGTWVVSSVNSAPSVSSFSPVVARDGSGRVTVTTTISDAESNTTTLFVDFSVDNGSTWASSTIYSDESWGGTGISAVTGTISNVTTSPSGRSIIIHWGSLSNSVTSTSQVKFRIRPYDGTAFGAIVSSSAFTVDNVAPTIPGNLSLVSRTISTLVLGLNAPTSTDSNFLDYYMYTASGLVVTTTSPIAITSSTDANFGDSNFNGATTTIFTTTSSPNSSFSFMLVARDAYGNSSETTSTLTAYTLASVPSSLSASVSGNQITVSWSGNATQYYASYSGGNSSWISATQYAFTNLTCGTSYTFSVKGRNGQNVETSSGTVSAATGSCSGGGIISAPPVVPTPVPEPASEPQPEPTPEPTQEEQVKKEPKAEVKPEVKPEPKKEAEKLIAKTEVQKTDTPTTNNTDASSDTSGPSDFVSAPSGESQPNIPIADAGIKVVKQGEVLKVTNSSAVTLQLDTAYQTVTLQDESGRVVEKIATQSAVPWTLSEGDGQKCITATFYDSNGNVAKQKVTCVGLDTVAPAVPQIKNLDTKILLQKNGKQVSVRGTTEPNAIVMLRFYKVSPISFHLIETAHAASEGYFLVSADDKGAWSFTFPDIFEAGKYEIEVSAKDEAGNISQPVKRGLVIAMEGVELAVQKTVDAVQIVIDNPEVERINETFVAPAVVGVGVANVAAGAQLPQVFVYLRYLFTQPFLLLRRKKYKTWGTVYNAFTKQPVDLATVRLVHAEKGQVVRSQVTDTQGRYYMFGDPGEYLLQVDKNGFSGVSNIVQHVQEDGSYLRVYHGDPVQVTDDRTEINYSIPLEPIGEDKPASKIIRTRVLQVIQHAISLTGVVMTGFSFIISPEIKIALFFFIHLLFYAISYKLTHTTLPESYGTVRFKDNKKGLHNVVVRVFDSAYNKLVTTTLTDRKGRYAALVGPSVYYVAYEKPGFEVKKSDTINFSSQKTKGLGGMIVRDEELYKAALDTPPKEDMVVTNTNQTENKYMVMPILPETAPVSTAPSALVDSTSMNVDMPEASEKKSDKKDPDPDDIIAQWKQNH